jgi:hypothetical protein
LTNTPTASRFSAHHHTNAHSSASGEKTKKNKKVNSAFFSLEAQPNTMSPPRFTVSLTEHDRKYEPASVNVKTLGQGNFGTAKLMRQKVGLGHFTPRYIAVVKTRAVDDSQWSVYKPI